MKIMKSGFTMIELIFVIVILGILAAVALPKFVGMGEQAHIGNLSGFQGTLNRTLAPTVWGKVVTQGGSLAKLSGNDRNLSEYIDIPKEFLNNGSTDADLGQLYKDSAASGKTDILGNKISCSTDSGTVYKLREKGLSKDFTAKIAGKIYDVDYCNGSSTTAPKFFIRAN